MGWAIRPTKISCFILVAPFHTCCDCQELLQLWREADHLHSSFHVNFDPASILRRLCGINILLSPEIMMLRLPLTESLTGCAKFGKWVLYVGSWKDGSIIWTCAQFNVVRLYCKLVSEPRIKLWFPKLCVVLQYLLRLFWHPCSPFPQRNFLRALNSEDS